MKPPRKTRPLVSGAIRQAVYAAIHEEMVQLRLSLIKSPKMGTALDFTIAQAGARAGSAALAVLTERR